MITTSNFKEMLIHIGFKQLDGHDKAFFLKAYPTCELRVDFENNLLIYPEDKRFIVNERQTCNFNAPENFVVFECVDRLLSKGYKPEHIELEPKWKLGHGASGGRADILIKDNSGNALILVECKTWGTEFDSEWKNMNINGGQLFSYAQQIKSTQFLCLYTSGFVDGVTVYVNHIITLNDNKKYLNTLKEPLSFANATDVQALYKAWYVTYNHEYETTGIFEDAHPAYQIGKVKRTASDLQEFNHDDIQKKYHEFATILRQHNVSGRENAFDKLVNLFLAKIVDEMQNPDELMFHWRGVAIDNYYDLQDRIQRLYRDGMQKFLNEEVTYIDNDDIKKAFRLFKNDPDATRDQIEEYFRQLKFYTNNDFAFLDVHNHHLFLQNSVILLKIVRMIQDIKLKTEEQNQFLGDLFEGFLDQGVKQSEGQFFTPTPIVKFLVSSLPLKTLIENNTEPLNIIDYACGAGHFLNEYATQIRDYISADNLSAYYERIVGIEKEYRLSKVAKVSAFMYGQEEIQIVYADALAKNSVIQNGIYNVLVSNPPYSVKGFLETLSPDERSAFDVSKAIDNKSMYSNNTIEVFFVERAKQLLAPGGVAAIILPSSLLSNGGAVYTKAREIILQYFDIVAITELGSGTFGKTGTNTVTLFLRRKEENPALADHFRNRVNSWFNGDFEKNGVFDDFDLLQAYCRHIGCEVSEYKTLLNSVPSRVLLEKDEFEAYRTAFDDLAEVKYRMKQRTFKSLDADEQRAELMKRFIAYSREIEKDKLYYFMLANSNPQNVVVVKSPSGTNESKSFLGYEWSNRKGAEGIKYIGIATGDEGNDETLSRLKGIKRIQTPLFNPANLSDMSKINSMIRANFNGEPICENELVKKYQLVDMLDFSGVKFEKQINLFAAKSVDIVSKWPLALLPTVCELISGGTPDTSNTSYWDGDIPWLSVADFSNKIRFVSSAEKSITELGLANSNTNMLKPNDIIISARGTVGAIAQLTIPMAFNQSCYGLRANTLIDSGYLFYALKSVIERLREGATGSKFKAITTADLQSLKIPHPPLDVQREIAAACEAVDEEYVRTRLNIDEYMNKINELFNNVGVITPSEKYTEQKLRTIATYSHMRIDCETLTDDNYVGVDNLLPNKAGKVSSQYVPQHVTLTGYKVGYILISNIRPYLKKIWFADRDGGCSNDVLALRVATDKVLPRYLYYTLSSDKFFDYEMQYKKGVKMPRGDKRKIMEYKIIVPSIDVQEQLIAKALEYERLITEAEHQLHFIENKRESLLSEYLQ